MPTVIDAKSQSDSESAFLFKVCRSPQDPDTIFGYLEPYPIDKGDWVEWLNTCLSVPVRQAFTHVLNPAEQHGVNLVLVDDPENLFPAQDRDANVLPG
jgi:hypothetical protein